MDIKDILLDLEVIKLIKENDKLAVNVIPGSKRIFVDTYSYLSTFTRWYNGYNRESCIAYIEELVNNIEKSSEIIKDGDHNDKAFMLKIAINNSLIGFKNLINTYDNDSIIKAKLTLCVNSLEVVISELQTYLDKIMTDYND
tara:strand:+ start:1537 stop:1962 length:426 start_codon:yes stop_codon:yes gene_type:complete